MGTLQFISRVLRARVTDNACGSACEVSCDGPGTVYLYYCSPHSVAVRTRATMLCSV